MTPPTTGGPLQRAASHWAQSTRRRRASAHRADVTEPEAAMWRLPHAITVHVDIHLAPVALQDEVFVVLFLFQAHKAHARSRRDRRYRQYTFRQAAEPGLTGHPPSLVFWGERRHGGGCAVRPGGVALAACGVGERLDGVDDCWNGKPKIAQT